MFSYGASNDQILRRDESVGGVFLYNLSLRSDQEVRLEYDRSVGQGGGASSSLLTDGDRPVCMSLTADDFEKFLRGDDDERPLGDALADLALDVETDAVGAVREIREHE